MVCEDFDAISTKRDTNNTIDNPRKSTSHLNIKLCINHKNDVKDRWEIAKKHFDY